MIAHNALDQIIDRYYAAESKVNQTVGNLPTGIKNTQKENARPYTGAIKLETSTINSGNLIIEDWLAELVYKHGK